MQPITQWINGGRDYDQGVEIYLKHGRDPQLKRLFTAEEKTAFKEKKLLEALRGLLQRNPPVEIRATNGHKQPQQGWPPVPITDPVVAALHQQFRPLYAEMMDLQARIYEVAAAAQNNGDPTGKQLACTMAHRICELDDLVDQIYEKRDHYLAHGHLPGDSQETPAIAPHAWPKKLANAERYARDYKNRLQKKPGDAAAAAKLKFYQGEIAHYKKLLKLD